VADAIFSGIEQQKLYIFSPSLTEDLTTQAAIKYRLESIMDEKNQVNQFSGTPYDK